MLEHGVFSPTNKCSSNKESRYFGPSRNFVRARAGITEWLTFGSEEFWWEVLRREVFSDRWLDCHEEMTICTALIFFNGANYH